MAPDKITAQEMFARLKLWTEMRKGEWILMSEVRNATGFARSIRSADGLAVQCWPSAGIELHGFEIKVSRSDVVKELMEPAKAEAIKQFCDRWWLVISSAKLIKDGELPPDWGLLIVNGKHLKVAKAAPALKPKPHPRDFLASMVRSIARDTATDEMLKTARNEGWKEGQEYSTEEVERFKKLYQKATERLRDIEKQVGWSNFQNLPQLRERLRMLETAAETKTVDRLERLRDELTKTIDEYKKPKEEARDGTE